MTSIRRHILVWLMPGFLILWISTGTALYYSVKQRFEVELDASLRELLAALPFGNQNNRASPLSIEDFVKDDFGIYFQVWNKDGLRILKSPSLGRLALPQVDQFSEEFQYTDTELDNGEPIRTLSVAVNGGSLGDLKIVVAKTREQANASLRKVLIAIVLIAIIAGVLFALLLNFAVRSGLRPLQSVGEKASQINIDSLSERFAEDPLPSELEPIVARLNLLMNRLQGSFDREKRFSSDLAHELRTPVAALRSIAEVALKWPDQASDENYRDIELISGELQDTIESLLTLARLENARNKLINKDVNLQATINSCWSPFAERAAEKGLSLQMEIDAEASLSTDPKIFQLIVSNLISNAVSHAKTGVISINRRDDEIFTISNEAAHLAEADLPKLFDRLWRHDESRTDSGHSGLGLSIAKSSAEVLSMQLSAELIENFIYFSLK